MRIYSMTATFGKLEHETLTLEPGLNILEAPNEWGKSTWCAFLVAMLYGIETSARSTKTALADKERYAPWSGSPMSGRMDINWNGRDITIERRTKGRLIFGDFRAYETATGLDVPELTAANCGVTLLGVERSVFTRAGFLKLTDLPVTQDDSLRRRLNSLVTTGDESGTGDKLAQKLRDLKNKCRYNRSGLLPQAEAQRDQLLRQLNELQDLTAQSQRTAQRQEQLSQMISELENHKAALQYAAAEADAEQVSEAIAARDAAVENLAARRASCEALPSRQQAEQKLRAAQTLQDKWMALQRESAALPPKPDQPEVPKHYSGLADAVASAREDHDRQALLEAGRRRFCRLANALLLLAALICIGLLAARFGFSVENKLLYLCGGGLAAVTCIACLISGALRAKRFRREMDLLYDRHPNLSPDKWISDAEAFTARQAAYRSALALHQSSAEAYAHRRSALDEETAVLTGGCGIGQCQDEWNRILAAWDALDDAQRDLQQAERHAAALQSMAKTAQPPAFPDTLTCSLSQTDALLSRATAEQQQNHLRLGQLQGQAEALGQEAEIRRQLKAVQTRIEGLEETYQALELAQKALSLAENQLQRRFAPRISKRAQALFRQLTGGRYERINLGEDFSLSACAGNEDTLRTAQWRSDGTVDQLYLALRLAVAEELTPEAPLILDDALVRFDETRLKAAMDILKEEAEHKQVIVFTCQSRERKIME